MAKGLLVGSVIGSVLGLLYAPKSGKALRQQIVADTNQSKDTMLNALDTSAQDVETMQDSLTDLNQALNNFKNVAQETLPQLITESKETIEAFKFQAKPRVAEIKETTQQIKKHLDEFNPNKESF